MVKNSPHGDKAKSSGGARPTGEPEIAQLLPRLKVSLATLIPRGKIVRFRGTPKRKHAVVNTDHGARDASFGDLRDKIEMARNAPNYSEQKKRFSEARIKTIEKIISSAKDKRVSTTSKSSHRIGMTSSPLFSVEPYGMVETQEKSTTFTMSEDIVVFRTKHAHTAEVLASVLQSFDAMVTTLDQERVKDILQAYITAAMPLQSGAREQAQLAGLKMQEALSRVPMLTAREVGELTGSKAAKPEGLAAQWVNRRQIFGVDLAARGTRYPSFQFQPSGKPWPALADVLPTLLNAFTPLYLLLWFDAPNPFLNGRPPREAIQSKQELLAVTEDSLAPMDFY